MNESVGNEVSDIIFRRMAEMTILVTQLVVEFAKRMPGFLDLERDDQIILLKVLYLCSYPIRSPSIY